MGELEGVKISLMLRQFFSVWSRDSRCFPYENFKGRLTGRRRGLSTLFSVSIVRRLRFMDHLLVEQ
jgi:hypothetical protein